MNEVVIFKLTTGEEIIGTNMQEFLYYDNKIILDNVFMITTALENGMVKFYLDPFMIYSETTKFTFDCKHVILHTQPSQVMNDYYFKVVETLLKSRKENGALEAADFSHSSNLH